MFSAYIQEQLQAQADSMEPPLLVWALVTLCIQLQGRTFSVIMQAISQGRP